MKTGSRKFIYLNNKEVDGTVFQTQILDWINLFNENGVTFDLIQVFHIKDLKHPLDIKQKTTFIRKGTNHFKGKVFFFPSKSVFAYVNTIILYLSIFRSLIRYKEILIFSRALIGREIKILQKITRARILFFFDARAASAEEHRYNAIKQHDFSRKKYNIISNVYYLEYETVSSADKIFSVSEVLINYFKNTYNVELKKYVSYPCLSDAKKFYYDPEIRKKIRSDLNIDESVRLFIYAGGIEMEWHLTESMFEFYNNLLKYEQNLMFLFLTKNENKIKLILERFPELRAKMLYFYAPNDEVFKYLNAADYGILFRENHIMNNVASPTKFAEYMLCGLPVLISEGVGDYSSFAVQKDVGFLLEEPELKNLKCFDYKSFLQKKFDRPNIANIGNNQFSKQSVIKFLVEQFMKSDI